MEKSSDGFVRADQIDLKSLDEQLERHLNRVLTMEKNKKKNQDDYSNSAAAAAAIPMFAAPAATTTVRRQRHDWEIDPSKLIIKGVIARGTFGTVHRGVYDGQDVAVKLLDWGEEGHRTEAEIASLRAAFTQEVVVWHKLDHPNVTKFIGATMGSPELNIQTENGHIGMPSNICCVVVEYLPGGALKSYLIKNRRKKLAFKVVVLNGNPYNRKCDVYSFGICLWEIYCCDMPYPDLSFSEVTSAVVRQNLRPEIPRCCPGSLANVMKRCWDANPDKRPEMDEVVAMLEAIDTSKGGGMIPLDQQQGCLCFRTYRGP
ncbi:Serine/threonine-protein kinase EDR1 [Sesamum alatum]|uniref:Serine/threonine-protein kinase EDR1 n=1 Tax=Sesamum alatum TaxID=300844 RepID=A0AAE1YBW9_9LAMI|nr:Serine/threonine-protein kinase EDR1 [Sesamum alatum]